MQRNLIDFLAENTMLSISKSNLKSAIFSDFNKGENIRFWLKWDESPKITDKFLLIASCYHCQIKFGLDQRPIPLES